MGTEGNDNLQRLIDAGVVLGDLPRPHATVVEGMTEQEIDVIIAVKSRFEAADEWAGAEMMAPAEVPHWVSLIRF
jgi:hypothetical protein